jgi:hypothetical protein
VCFELKEDRFEAPKLAALGGVGRSWLAAISMPSLALTGVATLIFSVCLFMANKQAAHWPPRGPARVLLVLDRP